MQCQNCHQPLETGAAFCGNCGHPVAPNAAAAQTRDETYHPHQYTPPSAPPPSSAQAQPPDQLPPPVDQPAASSLPAYAAPNPTSQSGETKALLSIMFGVLGLIGAIIPLVGLAIGITGVVMGTMSRHSPKRTWSTVGLVLSSLAIVASLGVWTYMVKEELQKRNQPAATATTTNASQAKVTADLTTPCYAANLIDRMNVSAKPQSCDATAYNGRTFGESTDAYKIFANKANINDPAEFTPLAKAALEKDIKTNLSNFTIDSLRVSTFAGSPAYTITASSKAEGLSVIETAVYHPVANGENIFIIVHGINGENADLKILEAKWQWK